jgi:hypothetical protein
VPDIREIDLIRVGKFHMAGREVDVTSEQLDEMVEEFQASAAADRRGIDFDHKAMQGETKMGAWIKSVRRVDDKLVGEVELTGAGQEELAAKNYRFVSAEYATKWRDKATGKWISKAKLNGATFTNRPVIEDLTPVALSEHDGQLFRFEPIFLHDPSITPTMNGVTTVSTQNTSAGPPNLGWAAPLVGQHFGLLPITTPTRESETMPDKIREVLQLADTATEDEVVAAVQALAEKSTEAKTPVDETKYVALSDHEDVVKLLSETTKQVNDLTKVIHDRERDAFISSQIDAGRVEMGEKEALTKLYDLDADSTRTLVLARKANPRTVALGFSGGPAVNTIDVEGSRDTNRVQLAEAATKLLVEGRAPNYGEALILAEKELGA